MTPKHGGKVVLQIKNAIDTITRQHRRRFNDTRLFHENCDRNDWTRERWVAKPSETSGFNYTFVLNNNELRVLH